MIRSAPLGYDLRISGAALARHMRARALPDRLDALPTSYDTWVAPSPFVPETAEREDWQEALPDTLFADPFYATFEAFRSDRDALSVLGDKAPADLRLYRYVVFWDEAEFDETQEPMGGRLRAMAGDAPAEPTLTFALVGYDLLDEDEVSIRHRYADDLLTDRPLGPDTFRDVARDLGLDGTLLIQIEEARHPYWFPD